jgi:tRNA threonylcarbamoyladenosine biosynthesis protein TsaE
MRIESEAEMLAFGRDLSARLNAGDVVAITGPLGAGKTVFCKGVLAGMGFRGEVTSPTYTIVHQYDPPDVRLPLAHVDLYRIKSPEEVGELGLFEGDSVTLVEWAENYPPLAAIARYTVRIMPQSDGARAIATE